MKKILLLIILISLSGCANPKKIENNITENKNKLDINVQTESYIDKNEVKVGLYQNKELVNTFKTTPANHKEIAVFNIFYTNSKTLDSSNIKYNWNKYIKNYQNIENHKIGFYITFTAEDKKIEKLILDPTAKHSMTPYLYVYLYDDIHQKDGTWYSHLEPENMKENTIFSSIKLYFAASGSKVNSDITLTVFTYDTEDDFNELNQYRGNSRHTITIHTK